MGNIEIIVAPYCDNLPYYTSRLALCSVIKLASAWGEKTAERRFFHFYSKDFL